MSVFQIEFKPDIVVKKDADGENDKVEEKEENKEEKKIEDEKKTEEVKKTEALKEPVAVNQERKRPGSSASIHETDDISGEKKQKLGDKIAEEKTKEINKDGEKKEDNAGKLDTVETAENKGSENTVAKEDSAATVVVAESEKPPPTTTDTTTITAAESSSNSSSQGASSVSTAPKSKEVDQLSVESDTSCAESEGVESIASKSSSVNVTPAIDPRSFWKPPNTVRPMQEQVVITDIVSNDTMITVRECPSETGFFKKDTSENKNIEKEDEKEKTTPLASPPVVPANNNVEVPAVESVDEHQSAPVMIVTDPPAASGAEGPQVDNSIVNSGTGATAN